MKTGTFLGGLVQPALGLATWRMGESRRARGSEIAAVRSALEMGYRVVDTADRLHPPPRRKRPLAML